MDNTRSLASPAPAGQSVGSCAPAALGTLLASLGDRLTPLDARLDDQRAVLVGQVQERSARARRDGRTVRRTVTARANFLSQNPRAVHVGLDGADVEHVRVAWTDGHEVHIEDVRAGSRPAVAYNGTVEAGA